MPRQQRFDGDSLEAVLERVRTEAGPGAKVLEAKKVRDGGVAGFFSKERFVLTVQLPDEPVRSKAKKAAAVATAAREAAPEPEPDLDVATGSAPPSSILEMVDLVDEAESRLQVPVAEPPRPAPIVPPLDFEALDPPMVDRPRIVHDAAERPPAPLPSTETASFQDVLRRLAVESAGEEPATPTGTPVILDAELPVVRMAAIAEPMEVELDLADLDLGALDADLDVDDEIDDIEETTDEIDHEALVPAVPVASTLVARARRYPSAVERTMSLQLLELGLPPGLVPDVDGSLDRDALHATLLRCLQLPTPPALPRRASSVVAVIGEKRAAVKLAQLLADEPALTGAGVQVADKDGSTVSIRRARATGGKSSATRQRQRTFKRIIVLPASPGSSSGWASELLDDLQPDMVWGVVPADRKSEDIAAWAVGVGGLDVLALTNLDRTVSPATALGLGIPVGLIDWQLATPEAWADLLTDRLAA